MKIVRRILTIILIIMSLIVLAGFLLPAKVHMERSIFIAAPRDLVFNEINTIRNWEKWSPWKRNGSILQIKYAGPESGTGATQSWMSANSEMGNGSIRIEKSNPFDSIQVIMDFSQHGKSLGNFIFLKKNGGTLTKWVLESELGNNPVTRWFGLFIDKLVGPDFESGLSNLKQLIEKTQLTSRIIVTEINVPEKILLTVKDTATPETFVLKLSKIFERISNVIKKKKLECTGSPVTIYYRVSDSLFEFEAGIPVYSKIFPPKGINCVVVAANKSISVKHFGSFQSTTSSYIALANYLKENDYISSGPAWEEYITDPYKEPDTTKWQTNIYMPVKQSLK